ncbi:uncharacterized protein si:ch211-234p6.5 isoform X2 [Triplophysa dalaica]|uniref:uncharacterized protein si:ch211-234p6.5 isoform X2 n=1 Tax=Triplophysa dalaica TaxID=1582913 RepID=UPI0024DF35F2|nr:uncharacterized protein si:ch211-234p6.5 isoform X2 [Triplophysa dalaica]
MTLELAVRHRKQSRMEDQDRVSQTSSVATVSFIPNRDQFHEKVQTFGKRCHAVKRDPNCPVVIRGWLYKRDSTGLKLWKRRWFVLSNYCLYYYKDSREESVLGSIPIPSYRILYCSPRECRNRKYAFKVVHQGMRPYIMSAETQEDMLGWVRALSQSANMEADDILNRRCSSFQDFTQMRDDAEMMELQQTFPERNTQTTAKLTRAQTEPTLQDQPMMGTKTSELRGKHGIRSRDPEALQQSQSLGKADEEPFSFQLPTETLGNLPLFARDQYGCQGNVGRDGWPLDNSSSAPLSPCIYTERRHLADTRFPCGVCYCSDYHTAEHMTLCKTGTSDILFGREVQPIRDLENDTDVVLTRLCGCDKLLQSLSMQLTQLHADKKSVECALERRWFEMDDVLPEEHDVSQKALLQEDLVTLRARICDVSSEMDRLWSDYERMESELSVFHSHFQHILHFGTPQEQIQAQRQLWMMEDILCGLRVNKNRLLGLQTPGVPQPKTLPYFDGEFRGHDMDCVTQLEQQDFMKYHHNYTRNLKEISASDSRTSFDHDTKFSNESPHEPLQLTRVVTSTLPTPLMAECIFVEDHEQIHQQSALKNKRIPQKPSRMRHETTDKTRRCHWADLPEERDNPNKQNEFSAKADGKGWIHLQQQLEPEASYVTNGETDCDLAMTSQRRENKVRHMEREDRPLSAVIEHFTDDIQCLGLISANEKETDTNKCTTDEAVLHLNNGYSGNRHTIQSNGKEIARLPTPHTKLKNVISQQSSCNDIIVIESHSINHISTLTVFKGHQGNNQTNKPQKKTRNSDGQKFSGNLKSECFLSNRRWCEVAPADHQKAFLLPLENQQTDQESNRKAQNVENNSSVHEGQNGVDFEERQSPKTSKQLQDAQSNQPITTSDKQSTCTPDHSKPDQCIYEEIQMIPPTSEDPKPNQNNHSQTSIVTADKELATEEHGEYSSINTESRKFQEVSKGGKGSDVTCKRGKGQKGNNSIMKSSVVNHHVQDCRPRITVVSTSL